MPASINMLATLRPTQSTCTNYVIRALKESGLGRLDSSIATAILQTPKLTIQGEREEEKRQTRDMEMK